MDSFTCRVSVKLQSRAKPVRTGCKADHALCGMALCFYSLKQNTFPALRFDYSPELSKLTTNRHANKTGYIRAIHCVMQHCLVCHQVYHVISSLMVHLHQAQHCCRNNGLPIPHLFLTQYFHHSQHPKQNNEKKLRPLNLLVGVVLL